MAYVEDSGLCQEKRKLLNIITYYGIRFKQYCIDQKSQFQKLFIYFVALGPSLNIRSIMLTACSKGGKS